MLNRWPCRPRLPQPQRRTSNIERRTPNHRGCNGPSFNCWMFDVQRSMFSVLENKEPASLRVPIRVREMRERHKMIRMFLCGTLCGVMMAAALTFSVALPANNDHWRIEIVKRGGGSWYFDKNGHLGWTWTVEPIRDHRPAKRVIVVPAAQKKVSHDRL